MRNKATMTLSFSAETKSRLRTYAEQRHTTVSQAITDWIWAQPIQESPIPGQAQKATEIKKITGVEKK